MKKLFVTIAICAIIGGAANAQSIKILNSNGNVGIGLGANSPLEKLHVSDGKTSDAKQMILTK
jgi:hypothetical protein